MKTINIILKANNEDVVSLENWLISSFDLISFRIIPDTQELYDKDATFRKYVKCVKDAQEIRDKYINEHN